MRELYAVIKAAMRSAIQEGFNSEALLGSEEEHEKLAKKGENSERVLRQKLTQLKP